MFHFCKDNSYSYNRNEEGFTSVSGAEDVDFDGLPDSSFSTTSEDSNNHQGIWTVGPDILEEPSTLILFTERGSIIKYNVSGKPTNQGITLEGKESDYYEVSASSECK